MDVDTTKPPLTGIRVVDLTRWQSGPLATMVLGDMGADVIKVESLEGEATRHIGVTYVGDQNAFFLGMNRNKRDIALDLRSPDGLAIVRELALGADVFAENFRPGTVEKMGLSSAALLAANPRLVYCSVSAFGQSGPLAYKPGLDPVLQGIAGIMSVTGDPDRPPAMVGVPIVDGMSAMLAVQAIMMALFSRERTGLGQRVDVNMLDAALMLFGARSGPFFASKENPGRWGNAHPQHVPHQAFETKDGWLNVDVLDDDAWRRLCSALDRPEWAGDERFATRQARHAHRDEVIDRLVPVFRARTSDEWMQILDRHDVMGGPVYDFHQACNHPQTRHNNMVLEVEHPTAGIVKMLGIPIRLERTPGRVAAPPPLLGQHSDEVLREIGYDEDRIAGLRARKIVR